MKHGRHRWRVAHRPIHAPTTEVSTLITIPMASPNSSADTAVIGPASGTGMSEVTRTLAKEYSKITAGSLGSKEKPNTVVAVTLSAGSDIAERGVGPRKV